MKAKAPDHTSQGPQMASTSAPRRRQSGATPDYDQKTDLRVTRHQCLRNRNNSTSCRRPFRHSEAEARKTELQEKRHLEFLKRRQIETPVVSDEVRSQEPKQVPLRAHLRRSLPLINNRRSVIRAEDLGISWPELRPVQQWVIQLPSQGSEKRTGRQQAPNPAPLSNNPAPLYNNPAPLSNNPAPLYNNPAPLSSNPAPLSKPSLLTLPLLLESLDRQKTDRGVQTSSSRRMQDASAQTRPGLVTVKESDLQKLTDYLQEALRRENGLKQKLSLLQCHAFSLLQTSDKLWTSRCDEDLMKSRIGVLEAQLKICTEKLPRDGVKKLVLQMEEQRRGYEQKALRALQRATEEKSRAEERTESLQAKLQAVEVESVQWQSLYEDLKESCDLLRSNQERSTDLVNEQQNQLETAAGREADLRDQLTALRHEGAELRARVAFLEQDNQAKLEQLLEMRDSSPGALSPAAQLRLSDGSPVAQPRVSDGSPVAELRVSDGSPAAELRVSDGSPVAQLRVSDGSPVAEELNQHGGRLQEALEKLGTKERECGELRAELEAVEQECHSYQSRLALCREELRQLSARRSKRRCSSWLGLALLLLLVVLVAVVVSVALVCVYHPPFSHSLQGLYRVLQQRVEQYLHQMASPELPGCYRPV